MIQLVFGKDVQMMLKRRPPRFLTALQVKALKAESGSVSIIQEGNFVYGINRKKHVKLVAKFKKSGVLVIL